MAKQNEQKQKSGRAAQRERLEASARARYGASRAKTPLTTKPLPRQESESAHESTDRLVKAPAGPKAPASTDKSTQVLTGKLVKKPAGQEGQVSSSKSTQVLTGKLVKAPAGQEGQVSTRKSAPASTERIVWVPGTIRRRQFLLGGAGLVATAAALGGMFWVLAPHSSTVSRPASPTDGGDQLVGYWNSATLDLLRDQQTPLPVAARTLSIVHTCMFDAWAAYDSVALGTRLGASLRQPDSARTLPNKCQAISYAAARALADLFPAQQERIQHLLMRLKYQPASHSASASTPAGIGILAAQAVLDFRHNDGSNQLGDQAPGAYTDYTHYEPLNTPDQIKRPNHWQPLSRLTERIGLSIPQQFACAHWANVTPFAIASAEQFVFRPGPARYPANRYTEQAQQILHYSATLTDEQKLSAEYWSTASEEQVLARWFAFASFISRRDGHTLDQNIKLFFSLANATLDTTIACWANKRAYDSPYPITAIRYLFKDKQIHAWAGPDKGLKWYNGQYWLPYQSLTVLAPDYPEYCSEQSAISSAASCILRNFTGSDALNISSTWPAHSSSIEPNVPGRPVTLTWRTFSQAAQQADLAGRYSGTHFPQSDLDGHLLGDQVAAQVWHKAQEYITGRAG